MYLLSIPISIKSFRDASWNLSGTIECWAPRVLTKIFQCRGLIDELDRLLIKGIHAWKSGLIRV